MQKPLMALPGARVPEDAPDRIGGGRPSSTPLERGRAGGGLAARRAADGFELVESMRWQADGGYRRLGRHLARMAASARCFGVPFEPAAAKAALARAAARRRAAAKVRLVLHADGRVALDWQPLPAERRPVRIRVAAEPIDSREPLLYHKTTRRDPYDTRLAAHPGCDDVILINQRDELTESTIANLVVALDGILWTPPLESGLLPGVFRATLLRGGVLRERVLHAADLARADAVWLINSVREWRRAEVAE